MTSPRNLLVELLVEEMPPKALKGLGEAFADGIFNALEKARLVLRADVVGRRAYASPRRLAAYVPNVLAKAPDRQIEQKLMPVAVGLDANGDATPALLKRLLGLNLGADAVPGLKSRMEGKSESLFVDILIPGVTLDEGLQKALDETLAQLPIPKLMSYQLDDGWSTVQFVRPAHGLVALHGDEVVRCYALGLATGRATQGHRFEATRRPIELRDADSYAEQLHTDGGVIASFAARRAELEVQLKAAAAREGLVPIDDDALLDEVTALVERPNVLVCEFESQYLAVPAECLILTMKANQKYFPLLEPAAQGKGRLTHKFLVVSNIRPADTSRVIEGNERVVRPRLADAKFFFDQDRKKTLASRVPLLSRVVYHGKLGTQGERVERLKAIVRAIGERLGGASLAASAEQAASLAKADLLTDMVGEFPELQGVMGGYYARHDGLSEEIAIAIEDHYKPRFAGDELPRNTCGIAVALADKLETLAGMFGIGQVPTGDKDPYALRRHALGVIRMVVERELPLPLADLVHIAFAAFAPGLLSGAHSELESFMYERFAGLLRERGYSASEVDAVLSMRPARIDLVPKQLEAVRAFAALPEAASLAAANKRVGNILKKAEGGVKLSVDTRLLNEPAETALNEALRTIAPQADAAFERGDYTASLRALAALKTPVDDFFDGVMVNADDAALRANRLGLLATLHAAMNRVADLSKLAV